MPSFIDLLPIAIAFGVGGGFGYFLRGRHWRKPKKEERNAGLMRYQEYKNGR